MYTQPDMVLWQGRIDNEESPALRWHQQIVAWDGQTTLNGSTVLLGFCCDEGVRRNHGRPGAYHGPAALRQALANLAYHQQSLSYDGGDVVCDDQNLEAAQNCLADQVTKILQHGGRPIVIGGGHEMAWGSFLGLAHYTQQSAPQRRIGILNFDAHFDLRNPHPQANSGTAFRQIAAWCAGQQQPFNYLALGINPSANTTALFDFATKNNVTWRLDRDCTLLQLNELVATLTTFLQQTDDLYLTICLDVFPTPGVSAPAALGIEPIVVIKLLHTIKKLCAHYNVTSRLFDIAELNPSFDQDNRTAKLAARLVGERVNNLT